MSECYRCGAWLPPFWGSLLCAWCNYIIRIDDWREQP